jgi:large subunit ribosomal protein L6
MTSARIAKNPVHLDSGVQFTMDGSLITIKGKKGELRLSLHALVSVKQEDAFLHVSFKNESKKAIAIAGTTQRNLTNMVLGVTNGYEKKLKLMGVGYRAQVQGNNLNLSLGFSHPVNYMLPDGIQAEMPSQTEIVIKGIDKQKVGQVSAEIRAIRPPEYYKGKGVRYDGEVIELKETKKK